MGEYIDDKGNVVTAFSQEEVDKIAADAKLAAAQESAGKLTELQTKMAEKEAEIAKAAEEIKKYSGKDYNFRTLEDSKNRASEELGKMRGDFEQLMNALKGTIKDTEIEKAAQKLSGGNKSVEDKIVYYFKSFNGEPKDKAEFEKRMNDAKILAAADKTAVPGSAISGAGNNYIPPDGSGKKTLEPEVEDMLKSKMGIGDDDIEQAKEAGVI